MILQKLTILDVIADADGSFIIEYEPYGVVETRAQAAYLDPIALLFGERPRMIGRVDGGGTRIVDRVAPDGLEALLKKTVTYETFGRWKENGRRTSETLTILKGRTVIRRFDGVAWSWEAEGDSVETSSIRPATKSRPTVKPVRKTEAEREIETVDDSGVLIRKLDLGRGGTK